MLQKFCKADIRNNDCIHIRYGKMVDINNLTIQFEKKKKFFSLQRGP